MNALLGSQFEASLRVLLLLEAARGEMLTEGTIAALDFIAVYSRDFGFGDMNLHGDSKYRFGEFASRRTTIKYAVKQLVVGGLVTALGTPGGFKYKLSNDGLDFSVSLNSKYADAYYDAVTQVLDVADKSENTLVNAINRKSIESVRRG
jgi:hypothetical protein